MVAFGSKTKERKFSVVGYIHDGMSGSCLGVVIMEIELTVKHGEEICLCLLCSVDLSREMSRKYADQLDRLYPGKIVGVSPMLVPWRFNPLDLDVAMPLRKFLAISKETLSDG